MRANWEERVVGARCVLVPYRRAHVARYHAWMQSPALLAQTASDKLSLLEELEMQASWREDPRKLTFIVLDARGRAACALSSADGEAYMCGDVNLFFHDSDDAGFCEVEVMVAEDGSRRGGIAREAVTLLLRYAAARLRVTRVVAKIGQDNAASLSLFRGLGFAFEFFSPEFQEHTLGLQGAGLERLARPAPGAAAALEVLPDHDLDADSAPYESCEAVDQYLALHFGQHGEAAAQTVRPSACAEAAIGFPQRCARLLSELAARHCARQGRNARALDLGCAVGGAVFELSRVFGFVRGVDLSASFVACAKQVRDGGPVAFSVPVEGGLRREGLLAALDTGVARARCEFSVGDACAPAPAAQLGGPFDALLLANLLCRVPDPLQCLRALPPLCAPDAVVLVVSPYSWLDQYTPRERWLQQGDRESRERLVAEMAALGFALLDARDMPLVIREHERKYQLIVADAVAFRLLPAGEQQALAT
jgi:RimJ/RimL family protein N-acetyltransferase/SAM-dependent methyltransferase